MYLATGDYVEAFVRHSAGAALDIVDSDSTLFYARWVALDETTAYT